MNETAKTALELTRNWAVEELEAARLRVINLRVGGEAYNHAIGAVEQLTRLVDSLAFSLGEKTYSDPYPVTPPSNPEPEAPEPESEQKAEEPTPIFKLEDVRAQCGEARKKGVDIKGILADLGYKNLSAVDPKDYGVLLTKVNEALEALG